MDGASNHSGEQFKKDLVPLSGLTKSVVLIVCTGKKCEQNKILYAALKISRFVWTGRPVLAKKRFTLAKKVYNRWTLTLIGHPYSSARIQTKPDQLKG